MQRKFKVKALSRDTAVARKYFGDADGLEVKPKICIRLHAVNAA